MCGSSHASCPSQSSTPISCHIQLSGRIIIFTKVGAIRWLGGYSPHKPPFEVRSCEGVIIHPELFQDLLIKRRAIQLDVASLSQLTRRRRRSRSLNRWPAPRRWKRCAAQLAHLPIRMAKSDRRNKPNTSSWNMSWKITAGI